MDLSSRFQALGDPCRLQIVELLSSGSKSVGELKEHFSISLPGLLKHVRKLERTELIHTRKNGRKVMCTLNPSSLSGLEEWIQQQSRFWNDALNRLEGEIRERT